jgi:hypothetical protein
MSLGTLANFANQPIKKTTKSGGNGSVFGLEDDVQGSELEVV